jgi:hypothetical protein
MTSDNLLSWTSCNREWDGYYTDVRRQNIFFSKINSVKTDDKEWIDRLKGEVYFLRASTYNMLVALYGGVPIITRAYTLTDGLSVTRNTYDECISFIAGQLDSAAAYLPESYADANLLGRATKGAALALKSRVLLYAASDLHNPAKNSTVTSGYSNPELLGYTGGDASARWLAAKNAAKAVMDLGIYELYKSDPAPTDSIAQNFVDFFLSKGTSEDIMLQYFTKTNNDDWNLENPALFSLPNGYNCWGNQTPVGELTDDYEMKDGSRFDWNNPVHKAHPYANREARFYATIFYEGVHWYKRPNNYTSFDPFDRFQFGEVDDPSGNLLAFGIDTRYNPYDPTDGTYTGYHLRKFIDPTVDAEYYKQEIPFKHMRYAEILLNYAEACIELSQYDEARTYINMIRHRAGQPDLSASLTGDALRQAYRHERRIELACEDKRWFDIRRWMIGQDVYHQMHGVDIRYTVQTTSDDKDFTKFFVAPSGYSGTRSDKYRKEDGSTWGVTNFSNKEASGLSWAWKKSGYFFPIMRQELLKNNKLVQNPDY